ncbi:hypothetical protein K2X33_11875 [bacterium]|nr:hypothetical protein [bacterium]
MRFYNRQFWLRFWLPLTIFVFVGGTGLSIHFFPGPFDWRYRVVSGLASQIDNPAGYAYFCATLCLVGAMLAPLGRYLQRAFTLSAPRTSGIAGRALTVGLLAMSVIGLERLYFRNLSAQIYKAHELIALVGFAGLFTGVLGFWLCLRHSVRGATLFVALGPFLGAIVSQAYLYFKPEPLGWVGPHWAELGIPVYLSFAFWEWVAAAGVFLYLYLLVALAPSPVERSRG